MSDLTLWRAVAQRCASGDADPLWYGRWCHARAAAERQAATWRATPEQDCESVWIERWKAALEDREEVGR